MIRIIPVSLLWVLAVLASADVKNSFSATPSATVMVAEESLSYKVRDGEYLGLIARRFGVTLNELLSENVNPALASRQKRLGHADLLYAEEVIKIPHFYRIAKKPIEQTTGETLVVVPRAMTKLEAGISPPKVSEEKKSAPGGVSGSPSWWAPWAVMSLVLAAALLAAVAICLLFVVIFFFFRNLYRRKKGVKEKGESTFLEQADAITQAAITQIVATPEQFMAVTRKMTAKNIIAALQDVPLIKDERGNNVYLQNFVGFAKHANRQHLLDVSIERMEEILRRPPQKPSPVFPEKTPPMFDKSAA